MKTKRSLSKEQTQLALAYHIAKTTQENPDRETGGQDNEAQGTAVESNPETPLRTSLRVPTPALLENAAKDGWHDMKAALRKTLGWAKTLLSGKKSERPEPSLIAQNVAWFTTSTWFERLEIQGRIIHCQTE